MLRVLACLTLVGLVCGSLRGGANGADSNELNDIFYGHKESLKVHEASMHDFIDSAQDTLLYKMKRAPSPTPKHVPAAYNGGFLVSRKSSVECSGEASSLVATSVPCKRVPVEKNADPLYLSIACLVDDATSYRGQLFRSDNCSGEAVFELENRLPVCDSRAIAYQCMPKQDGSVFGSHKGLFTYKFRKPEQCLWFGQDVLKLNTQASYDAAVNFDDVVTTDDVDNNDGPLASKACCLDSEVAEGCPYSVCPDPHRRELRGEEERGGAAGWRATRPARWWESKLKTQHVKHSLDAPPRDAAWYSEYSVTQHHSDVCSYDETRRAWVKPFCDAQHNTLTYSLFADAGCTTLSKEVQGVLDEVVPNYGKCVMSSSGDGRTALTVCRN